MNAALRAYKRLTYTLASKPGVIFVENLTQHWPWSFPALRNRWFRLRGRRIG